MPRAIFNLPGTYNWPIPSDWGGLRRLEALGGGEAGTATRGGGGGGFGWITGLVANPGDILQIKVGRGGVANYFEASKNKLVSALQTAGLLQKLDALYLFMAPDEETSLINWANPGTYDCVKVNTPNFLPYEGWQGNLGTLSYLDTQFNPAIAPNPKFTQNSASFSLLIRNNSAQDQSAGGAYDGTGGVSLGPRAVSTSFQYRINQAAVSFGPEHDNSIGFWSLVRPASNGAIVNKNGARFHSNSQPSIPVRNMNMRICGQSDTSISTFRIGAAAIGNLTEAEDTLLWSHLSVFVTEIEQKTFLYGEDSYIIFPGQVDPSVIGRGGKDGIGGAGVPLLSMNSGGNGGEGPTGGGGGAAGRSGGGGTSLAGGSSWQQAKDALIADLTSNGVLAKLDALYLLAAPTEEEALINYANPGTYDCTKVNTPTFTPLVGFRGNLDTLSYLDTHFNPATAPSPKFTQDAASISIYVMNNAAENQTAMGFYDGTGGVTLVPRASGGSTMYRLNQNSLTTSGATHTDSTGWWTLIRESSGGASARKNGAQFSANLQPSVTPKNGNIRICGQSDTSISSLWDIGIAAIGALSPDDDIALYQSIQDFLAAISGGGSGAAGGSGGGGANGGSDGLGGEGDVGGAGGNNRLGSGGGAAGQPGVDGGGGGGSSGSGGGDGGAGSEWGVLGLNSIGSGGGGGGGGDSAAGHGGLYGGGGGASSTSPGDGAPGIVVITWVPPQDVEANLSLAVDSDFNAGQDRAIEAEGLFEITAATDTGSDMAVEGDVEVDVEGRLALTSDSLLEANLSVQIKTELSDYYGGPFWEPVDEGQPNWTKTNG